MKSKKLWVDIVAAVLSVLSVSAFVLLYFRIAYPKKYADSVERYAAIFGVRPSLVYSVIKEESGFNHECLSDKGAVGLMQLMPDTSRYIAESIFGESAENTLAPEVNIKYGTAYLAYLFEKFGDETCALAAYNAGEGNVIKWLSDADYSSDGKRLSRIPFDETAAYVEKVRRSEKIYLVLYRNLR